MRWMRHPCFITARHTRYLQFSLLDTDTGDSDNADEFWTASSLERYRPLKDLDS